MKRREFIAGLTAASAFAGGFRAFADAADDEQALIDAITPDDYVAFSRAGLTLSEAERDAFFARLPGLRRYDDAFVRALAEAKATTVADRPAVWFVYNMGLLMKTPTRFFAVDLCHRRAEEAAPLLDFALVTHNHLDHYTERFVAAMDKAEKKTVVNNFFSNYAAHFAGRAGGYTRGGKTFTFGDVTVRTSVSDHNGYLLAYTMPFEIESHGFVIYHTGDTSNLEQLAPTKAPDLWIVHPRCGLDLDAAVRKIAPKRTVIAHLNELGHARDRWRWSYADGRAAAEKVRAAGFEAAMPLWGERIV